MKSRMAKSVFCIAVFVMCSLPLLVFLNVKERFTDLYGFEPPKADMPPLSIRTFADRTFQKSFEDNYARNFFLRKTFLKTRNTLCDYINLSMFHEAYNHTIHEGRGNVLYEVGYLAFHLQARDPGMMRENPTMNLLKKAVLRFAEIGVDVVFVLTPDKVTMYPDEIPAYVNMFGELKSMDTQKAVAKFLCDHGMKAFDADGFLRDRKSKYTERMFPVAGTHWNALAVGLVVEELLQSISREGNRYLFKRFTGVSHADAAHYEDEDIGRLLNVWHSRSVKRNVNLLPCFSPGSGKSNDGSVLVTGDSYVAQIGFMLLHGNYFDRQKIVTVDKRTLTKSERATLSRDLRCVMVVLNTNNAWLLTTEVPNDSFLSVLAKDLHDIAFDERTVPFGERPVKASWPLEIYPGGPELADGFCQVEGKSVWTSGPKCEFRFDLPEKYEGVDLELAMTCWPLVDGKTILSQRAIVYVDGVNTSEMAISAPGEYRIAVPGSLVKSQSLSVEIAFPNATTPKSLGINEDNRTLALNISKVVLRDAK